MGEVLVRTKGFAAAARFLDNSEEIVRDHYSHIEAAERAEIVTDALSQTDQQVQAQGQEANKTNSRSEFE